jgi:hypothetical protein
MKRLVLGLIVGAAIGYSWGYGDGKDGHESVAARTLDKFGFSKLKAATDANDRRVNEASRP